MHRNLERAVTTAFPPVTAPPQPPHRRRHWLIRQHIGFPWMDILFLQRHEADVKALPRDDLVPELAANLESTLRELKHTLQAVVLVSKSCPAAKPARCASLAPVAHPRLSCHFAVLLQESRSNRKEVRQWLINTLAGLNIENRTTRRRRFAQFLPGGAACRGAEHQAIGQAVLQLLFEAAPAEVGALIAQDASLLRAFFQSSSKHAPLWFGHFRCGCSCLIL